MRSLEQPATVVGEVILRDSPHGMLVIPSLSGLTPGPHATHVHERPDCGPGPVDGETMPGGAAGGHYDPASTGRYAGPYGDGALGDLPNLLVEADGRAVIPVLAPRPRVEQVAGRALMIHAGADRYGPTFPTSGTLGAGGAAHDHAGMNMAGTEAGTMARSERGAADPPAAMRMYCGLIGPASTGVAEFKY